MPPRGNEALDFTPILTHYLFLFTSILSIIAWFIAFISQAIAESKSRVVVTGPGGVVVEAPTGSAVGVLWFGIFLQLFFMLGVFYTLASDSIAMHRFQISIFGAIAIVYAVQGVQNGIFTKVPALDAMAAGWLILAIVNILWVLYFTSEEDSLMLHIFNAMGTGGLTPPSRRRRTTRPQSVHNMSANNGYGQNYASGIGSHDVPYDSKIGGPIVGSGAVNRSQHSFAGGSPEGGAITRGMGGGGGSAGNLPVGSPGSIGGVDSNVGPGSPLMGSGAAGVGAGGSPPTSRDTALDPNPPTESFAYRAKAMYAYTASPDDVNEISFAKGEILDIVDKQGKWWQAKKADGTTGIAPSNYLQIV